MFNHHFLIEHPAPFAAHLINRRRMSDRGQQKEEMGRRGDAMDSSRQEGRMRKETPDLQYVLYSMREGKTADQSDLIDFAIECTDAQTS